MESQFSRRGFLKATAGMVSLAAVSACAPSAPAQSTSADSGASQQASAEDATGQITCLFHGAALEGPYWVPRLEMYANDHPNVEFIALPTSNDDEYVQKISTMVAGGTPPDLTKISGGRMLATAPNGIFEDLNPRIETSDLMQRIWSEMPGQGSELTYCGTQVGVPQDLDFRMWFYNKALFDEAGVDYPTIDWTWDDIVQSGLAITDSETNQFFVMPGTQSFQDASDWYWQAGGSLFSDDCMQVNFTEEPNIEAMKFLVSLFNEYKIAPSPALGLGDIGVSFDSGKLGVTMSSSGTLAAQLGDNSTWDFEWGSVFAPTGPATGQGFVKSNGWAVLQDAEFADLAWDFIEWWHSDDIATAFAEMGELVPRADRRNSVSLKNVPEEHHAAIARAGTQGRGLERCPAWSAAQKNWRQELDTAITGNVSVEQAMATAAEKSQVDIDEIMAQSCSA